MSNLGCPVKTAGAARAAALTAALFAAGCTGAPEAPAPAPTAAEDRAGDSTVVPVFAIDVDGRAIVKGRQTPGVLRVIERHDGPLSRLDNAAASVDTGVTIEVHGSTTATLPKKSYDIELTDADGDEARAGLLGMPPHSDWVLHGCGRDQTCLRNALVYALGRDLGRYAPRTAFVELVLDGNYQGLYVLVERIRRDASRVDLPRPADDPAGGDITGGYIFRMELGQGTESDRVPRDWVSAVSPMVYSYHYPGHNRITPAQRDYLRDHMARFESMMQGEAWNHPARGYRAWLDVPSWVDFALIQELTNNIDAYQKSVYLQKWPRERGNRIAIGPVWDFDNGFGVANFRDGRRTDVWAHTMNRFGGEPVPYNPPGMVPHVPAYWERLWSDVSFHDDLQCRWRQLRAGPLRVDAIEARIDEWVRQVSAAQARDGMLWKNPESSAYPGEIDYLKQFVGRRVAWMDANLPGTCRRQPGD